MVRLGPLQFRVEGKHRPYYDVNLELDTPCDCDDAKFHGRGCLHELAARLQNHDYPLMVALNEQLQRAEDHAKENGQCPA